MQRFNALSCFIMSVLLLVAPFGFARAATLRMGHELTPRGATHALPVTGVAKIAGVGSSNTLTADPPVPRPDVAPCVKRLFNNSTFSQYAAQAFAYEPPAGCPGPFAKIVFNGNFRVSAGIQFDRTASIEIGNVPIFSERRPSRARISRHLGTSKVTLRKMRSCSRGRSRAKSTSSTS